MHEVAAECISPHEVAAECINPNEVAAECTNLAMVSLVQWKHGWL